MAQRLIEKMELHDTLNPKFWENDQLIPEVEEKLDDIIDQFILELQNNDIPIKVLDARLVGSNASFNYTDNSDLDVHIVANFADTSCDVPVLNLLYNYFKKNFNDKYAISIHGVPVELYIEDINSSAVSNGIYSLYKREWIKFPEPIEIPDIDITDIFNKYKEKYQEIVKNQDAEAASDLIDELYLLRKDSISTDGEYGEGNLVFKEFRNKGYLDNLKQLLVDETSKELSLESLNESNNNNNVENIKRYIKNNFNISTHTIGGPFYILSNGSYLNLGRNGSHLGLDDELYQNGIIEQDPFDYSYLYPNTIMVDLFNAIRCSDGENLGDDEYNNPYIQLPKNLPTNAQFESLDDWIYSLGYNNKLFVDGVEYNLSEVSSEYIIKRIKRYYSSGQLYESLNPEIFYRITVINPDGKEAGLFRGLNKLLKRLWDNDDEIYDEINYPLSELEELTHYPENFNNKRAIFAYKEDKFNQIKNTLLDLEYILNAIYWEVKITKIRRPDKVIYEDEDQIAYDPKTTSVVEWLNESKEDNQKLIDHVGEEIAQKFFKLKPRIKSPQNDLYFWLKKEPVELQDFLDDLELTKDNNIENYYETGELSNEEDLRESQENKDQELDSNGNQLSIEQASFFKNSKIRDNSGKLLVCYHGTNVDFTEFKKERNDGSRTRVQSFWFTSNNDVAYTYHNNSGRILAGYLNIKHPFIYDAKGCRWSKIEVDNTLLDLLKKTNGSYYDSKGILFTSTNDILNAIYTNGSYDGIILKNIKDFGPYIKVGRKIDYNVNSDDYIIFNSNQFKLISNKNPTSSSNINEEFDLLNSEQEYTSANTSINSAKLPAIFSMVSFKPETINLDYGGGKFDNATNELSNKGVTNLIYDPYNRSAGHNKSVIDAIIKNGGADTATCSNVLNVIKEPEAREAVIKNIYKLLKDNGVAYFTVYEGTGKGDEGPTKSGYQLNRKTSEYVNEISSVFPNVRRKGKLIIASKSNFLTESDHTERAILDIKKHFDDQYTLDESSTDGDWGYHYGDLGKADYKHQFGGRNTGGFGTGVYFVGTPISQRKDSSSYKNRPEHKVDFSKYNLFRPRNNEQAYKLHDALLTINNMAPNFKRVPKQWGEVLDEFDKVFNDYYAPLNALDDDDHSTPVTLNKQALLKYIRKYIDYYPYKLNKDDDLMDIAREIENNLVNEAKEFYYILNNLSSALGYYNEDKLRKIVIDALQDKSDIAPATLIMKALGYDGVDVRHLDHDAQGLSGLDNFGFGSVIYDLKESK